MRYFFLRKKRLCYRQFMNWLFKKKLTVIVVLNILIFVQKKGIQFIAMAFSELLRLGIYRIASDNIT